MYCNNCGKQITDDSVFCTYCGKEIVKIKSNQIDSTSSPIISYVQKSNNQNLPVNPEINVRVIQDPNQNIGFGMEYALHSNKSYIGYAWLTILLYIITFWIGGFIANIVYLNAAITTRKIIKRDPPGFVFLIVILVLANSGIIFIVISMIASGLYGGLGFLNNY
jgi:hypothetical protein